MTSDPSRERNVVYGTTVAIALFVVSLCAARLSGYGIWDPWELSMADAGRHLLEGTAVDASPERARAVLASIGFSMFGVYEFAGRIPAAFFGVATLALGAWLAWTRGGLWRTPIMLVVLGTSPLMLLNARHMMGYAPAFFASGLVFAGAHALVFPRAKAVTIDRAVGAVMLAIGVAFGAWVAGVLLAVLPPLAGVAVAILAEPGLVIGTREDDDAAFESSDRIIAWAVLALAVVVGVATVVTIGANVEGYSLMTGGTPRGGTPPTFELAIERVFHAFAPWSAILPLAIAHALSRANARREDRSLGYAAIAWSTFGMVAETVFEARFGTATFLPILGLAWLVATYLEELDLDGSWAAGVVALLLAALLVRDFRGYPGTPAAGLGLTLNMPSAEAFSPSRPWALTVGLFGLLAFLGFSASRSWDDQSLRRDLNLVDSPILGGAPRPVRQLVGLSFIGLPFRAIADVWRRSVGHRIWILLAIFFALFFVASGAMAWVFGDERPLEQLRMVGLTLVAIAAVSKLAWLVLLGLGRGGRKVWLGLCVVMMVAGAIGLPSLVFSEPGLSSLVFRIARVLVFVPFAVLLGAAGLRLVFASFGFLRRFAIVPMLLAGLAVGAYVTFGFQPSLSAHFSPREVYDTYNALAAAGEPLGEYRVGGRAATYYAHGEVRDLGNEGDVLTFLATPTRTWLAFRAEDLAQLNRAYRQRNGRHLFVVDAQSANVLLATNQPIPGRDDANYLANSVLDTVPPVQFPVNANFDRRVELVGYSLELPNHGDTVGPGQQFAITWVWRCLAPVTGGYQIFLHIDGLGQRLNGDHEPVQGRYPVRMWDTGDIVVDRQELSVPANYPPGDYTFNIGFYAGESRLEVLEGPEDDANRVIAGRLSVR